MTRKDYELIARVLQATRPPAEYTGRDGHVQANVVAHRFAAELAATNPRFDRARFLRACGVEG